MGRIEEVIVVVLIILLLFGSKKIPELARNLGKSVREVKKGFNEDGEKTDTKESKDSNTNTDK